MDDFETYWKALREAFYAAGNRAFIDTRKCIAGYAWSLYDIEPLESSLIYFDSLERADASAKNEAKAMGHDYQDTQGQLWRHNGTEWVPQVRYTYGKEL